MRLRDTGLAARRIGGQTVILDHNKSRYLTISGAGTLLFELLHADRDRGDLIEAVLETYDIDAETAARDVDAFIAELANAGLLAAEVDSER